MARWSQAERTATLVTVVGLVAAVLVVHEWWKLQDKYEDAMARWCPYWSTMPAKCEASGRTQEP